MATRSVDTSDLPVSGQSRLTSAGTLVPLLLLALVTTMGFTALGSFGTIQESAKAELALSDDALALIQGLGAAVPMVLFSIPIGILVDRRNRVRLTIILALLWTLGTLLTAFAPSAAWLTAARMLVGIGSTGSLTAALSLCADFCAPDQRGRAMLIVNLGKALGVALGFALTGWLFGLLSGQFAPAFLQGLAPWRGTHVLLAAISAVLLLPLLFLREPARREVERLEKSEAAARTNGRQLLEIASRCHRIEECGERRIALVERQKVGPVAIKGGGADIDQPGAF